MTGLTELLAALPWQTGDGPWTSVALWSRATVRRNLPDLRFGAKAGDAERERAVARLSQALGELPRFQGAVAVDPTDLDSLGRLQLVEAGLSDDPDDTAPLILAPDGGLAARLGGHDHLELFATVRGLDPLTARREVLEAERALEAILEFAFDDAFGYLTADPSRCGTALLFETMLHLPALLIGGDLKTTLDRLLERGLAFSAPPAAAGEIQGGLVVVRNTVTLGVSEKSLGRDFAREAAELTGLETVLRTRLQEEQRLPLVDRLHRALGTLRHCRLLPEGEARHLLSLLRLGRELDLLPAGPDDPDVDRLLMIQQHAHLARWAAENGEDGLPDAVRARFLRRLVA
ncbi:MAG TPA: hypothetical protein P5571_03790 [Candidatus Krumholzibacteria bacterium]|nr:hypothetical protein [Candidatus Krumholzibacteria bacterium]HRX50463.1 hypothetical protein [Candidatus Krumholzibacteria bacterium]